MFSICRNPAGHGEGRSGSNCIGWIPGNPGGPENGRRTDHFVPANPKRDRRNNVTDAGAESVVPPFAKITFPRDARRGEQKDDN